MIGDVAYLMGLAKGREEGSVRVAEVRAEEAKKIAILKLRIKITEEAISVVTKAYLKECRLHEWN